MVACEAAGETRSDDEDAGILCDGGVHTVGSLV